MFNVPLKPAAAIVALALVASSQRAPRKLRIAVAADLQFAMADLAREFRAAHPDIEVENVVSDEKYVTVPGTGHRNRISVP